jgi:hypothetical protein
VGSDPSESLLRAGLSCLIPHTIFPSKRVIEGRYKPVLNQNVQM